MNRIKLAKPLTIAIFLSVFASGSTFAADPPQTVEYATVNNPGQVVALPNNQLLITDIGNLNRTGGHVLITNFQRQLIWEYSGQLDIPHSAYPMPNGDILITDTGNNRVIEVNRQSQIVWDTDDLGAGHGELGEGTMSDGSTLNYPNDAKLLPNGDILISCRLQNRVIEITKQGRIVRDIRGFLHGQHNPIPIGDGDVLISDSGWDRILEVNQKNKIIWQFGGQVNGRDILSWPRDAQRLSNGDTLITDSDNDRLVLVSSTGKILHQYTNLARPYATAVLSNGNILVGDGSLGIVELTPGGKMVWQLNHSSSTAPSTLASYVRNSNFAKVAPGTNWLLEHWVRNDALAYNVPPGKRVNMARDSKVHHDSDYSARITYHGSSNGVYLGQTVRLTPGKNYKFTGWIKTRHVVACPQCIYGKQSIRGHTAEFELDYNATTSPAPSPPVLPEYTGTTNWSEDSVTFTVPVGVKSLDIHLELRGQGTVWFDNVWLQKLKG